MAPSTSRTNGRRRQRRYPAMPKELSSEEEGRLLELGRPGASSQHFKLGKLGNRFQDEDVSHDQPLLSDPILSNKELDRDSDDVAASWGSSKSGVSPSGHERKNRKCLLITTATAFALLLLGAVFGRPLLLSTPPTVSPDDQMANSAVLLDDPHAILTNGTHLYQKTILLVSIDGLRYDSISVRLR